MGLKQQKKDDIWSRYLQDNAQSSSRVLRTKKSVPQDDETDMEQIRALAAYFDEESQYRNQNVNKVDVKDQFVKGKEEQFDGVDESELENECAACLQSNFDQGKYILKCRHILCNECFIYWSNISTKCPACTQPSTLVMVKLNGSSRIKEIKPKYEHEPCQKCGGTNNEQQMYYCDQCQKNCIHVYCQLSLLQEKEENEWACAACEKYKPHNRRGKIIQNNKEDWQLNSSEQYHYSQSHSYDLRDNVGRRNREQNKKKGGKKGKYAKVQLSTKNRRI